MKRIVFSIVLVAGVSSCGTAEPSKEEAGVALVALDDEARARPLLEALERVIDSGAADEPPSSAGADPPPRPSASSTGAGKSHGKSAGTAPLLERKIIVDELRCARVDRATHRCDAVWRRDGVWRRERETATTRGRYLFTKKSGAWQATDDPPKR